MKPLPADFTENGFTHHQEYREGSVAIYTRSKGGRTHYETIRIKSHNGFVIPGTETKTPPAEYYPNSKSWGTDGFTFPTMEEAMKKARELAPVGSELNLFA